MRVVWTTFRIVAAVVGVLLIFAGCLQSASLFGSAPTGLEVAVSVLLVLECFLAGIFFIRLAVRQPDESQDLTGPGDRPLP